MCSCKIVVTTLLLWTVKLEIPGSSRIGCQYSMRLNRLHRAYLLTTYDWWIVRLRLADSCILAWVMLHTGACANAALLTYLVTYLFTYLLTRLFIPLGYQSCRTSRQWLGVNQINSCNFDQCSQLRLCITNNSMVFRDWPDSCIKYQVSGCHLANAWRSCTKHILKAVLYGLYINEISIIII